MTDQDFVRLHISPLNQSLLPLVLGPSLTKTAQDVSFHQLDTFPERNYGYVNLPTGDAKKLITKLNGAILKGSRMKVEEARPKKRSHSHRDEDSSRTERSAKKARRAENDDKLIAGYVLPGDRKVKRGWTESQASRADTKIKLKKSKEKKKSKAQASSKYSDKDELLFKTTVPDINKDLVPDSDRKRKSTRQDSTMVVHEFRKRTAQPSFLRNDAKSDHLTVEFVEGKGWTDQNGNIVEQEPQQAVAKRERSAKRKPLTIDVSLSNSPKKAKASLEQSADSTIPTPSSLSAKRSAMSQTATAVDDDETSSSGSSVTSEDVDSSDSDADSSVGETTLTGADDSQVIPETPAKVHPLEALFKKPKVPETDDSAKPSLEVETAFSFFNRDEAISDDELPPMPATPFTSYDLNSRGIRSAAPTPDTAHPSRFASFDEALASHPDLNSDIGEASDEANGTTSATAPLTAKPQSEFEKRFWQERSANNRAWKASRRAALKEQRQNQNRLRTAKKRR